MTEDEVVKEVSAYMANLIDVVNHTQGLIVANHVHILGLAAAVIRAGGTTPEAYAHELSRFDLSANKVAEKHIQDLINSIATGKKPTRPRDKVKLSLVPSPSTQKGE